MTGTRALARWIGHRFYLRYALKHKLLTMYHNPDTARPEPFSTSFFGLRYEGNFNSYIDWCIFYLGAYSRQELMLLKTLAAQLPANSVFVDVGANVGNHSLFASTVFGQVYSFEPVPWLARRIEWQKQINAIGNVTVFPYALGEAEARQEFYSSTLANQGMGTLIKGRETHVKPIQVEVKRGDSFLDTVGINHVDVLKVDVEGYERHVLNGLMQTIVRAQPIIFFEWSEPVTTAAPDLTHSPYLAGYSFFRFDEGQAISFFFNEDNFSLTPITSLAPDGNYVAIPDGRRSLVNHRIRPAA